MKRLSLKNRLVRYFQGVYDRDPTKWVNGAEIERLVALQTKYKPSNASRRLRELVHEEILECKDEGSVYYRLREEHKIKKQVVKEVIKNGKPYVQVQYV